MKKSLGTGGSLINLKVKSGKELSSFDPIEVILKQGGITCGAIDEPRKSSKAIGERVIINFRDKMS